MAFLARARPVLHLYSEAAALLRTGTWVVCVDEKTSIQAREAEQAPRRAIRRHCPRQSPRYKRRGARHLIAGLSVADGQVIGQCTARKRFVDFQDFITSVQSAKPIKWSYTVEKLERKLERKLGTHL